MSLSKYLPPRSVEWETVSWRVKFVHAVPAQSDSIRTKGVEATNVMNSDRTCGGMHFFFAFERRLLPTSYKYFTFGIGINLFLMIHEFSVVQCEPRILKNVKLLFRVFVNSNHHFMYYHLFLWVYDGLGPEKMYEN